MALGVSAAATMPLLRQLRIIVVLLVVGVPLWVSPFDGKTLSHSTELRKVFLWPITFLGLLGFQHLNGASQLVPSDEVGHVHRVWEGPGNVLERRQVPRREQPVG